MIRKFAWLIGVIACISITLYLVALNTDPVSLRLSSAWVIQAWLGFIMIGVFLTGVVCTALVTLLFGFRSYLRELGYRAKQRERDYFFAQTIKARSLQASGATQQAKQVWESLARRFPESVIAKIELARSLRAGGMQAEALKALDQARLAAPDNLELLFESADAHMALGNKTAALDFLALIQYQGENMKAARMARDLSEELDRIDDALEYQDVVERHDKEEAPARERLLFKKLLAAPITDKEVLHDQVRDFVRGHKTFAPALVRLAELEQDAGRDEDAASLYAQAGGITKDRELWRKAVSLWTKQKKPDRALAAARSACNNARGAELRGAQLDLVELKVDLGMNDEALKDLADLVKNTERQGEQLSPQVLTRLRLLQASALAAQANQLEIQRALESIRCS